MSVIQPSKKLVPVVLSNARSLSRERNFIKYDQDFIKELKSTTEQQSPSVIRKEITKTKRNRSVAPQKRN